MFDPTTMETDHRAGDDVPCWMLDTDYNGLVFHATRCSSRRPRPGTVCASALRARMTRRSGQHLAGDTSAPFAAAVGGDIAVKVIDERGNELPVVRRRLLKTVPQRQST